MKENKVCRVCGVPLVVGETITQRGADRRRYICQVCMAKHLREYRRRTAHRHVTCENKVCRVCGVPLVVGENVTQHHLDIYTYICRTCDNEWHRDWQYRTGMYQPMSKNRKCPLFLGVHVTERVLSHVFENVQRMPHGNPGFDFRCGRGYLVDAKAACRQHHETRADRWVFAINKNQIAEYFLFLAFNNRSDLTPEHIWLMPAENVNDHVIVSISETRLDKWKEYELPIDQVASCCDTMRGF